MKIVILGGSGAIGTAIQRDCNSRGLDYVAISRNVGPSAHCYKADLSLRKISDVIELCKDDIVILLFGYADQEWINNNENEAKRVNLDANINAIRELIDIGVYIVFFSTVDVFRNKVGKGAVETERKCPQTLYGRMKSQVEDYLTSAYDNYLIARSGWVVSCDNDCVIARTYKDMQRNKAQLASDACFNISHVDDVARSLVDIALTRVKDIVHLVPEKVPTRSQLGDEIIRASHLDLDYKKVLISDLKLPKNISFWLESGKTHRKYSLNMRGIRDVVEYKINCLEKT